MTNRYIRLTALSLFCLLSPVTMTMAGPVSPDDILGTWLITEDDEAVEKVEITKCGDFYCGKIVWLKAQDESDTPVTDLKNKADDLKDRPLVGLEVLQSYQFDGEDTWRDGKFYAYRKGKTVSPKLTLIDKDHLKIQVKILFVKKSFVWERVTGQ